ncbi:MAG TPA: response regulator [Ktedonobacteraceae bacterium]
MAAVNTLTQVWNSRRVILIIEDDEVTSNLLADILSQETNYRLFIANNAVGAFNFMKSIKPDLILLDYNLPGINGIEIFGRLRSMREFIDIPVIMISAYYEDIKQEIKKKGLIAIRKPFNLDNLLHTIGEVLV